MNATTLEEIRRLSDRIGALTGAGPAFLYSTAPTPGTFRLVLSDGVKYTPEQALVRLRSMLADVETGRGDFYCRVCRDAERHATREERDAHERSAHKPAALRRAGVTGVLAP